MVRKSLALALVASLAAAAPAFASESYPNLLGKAEQAGNFKTFIAAAKAAGLEDELKGSEKFTVFAPTDEAFAKLPAGTVERLMKPENKQELVKLLNAHIVPGKIFGSEWANEVESLKTRAGTEIKVDGSGSPFKIGEASIVGLNTYASNGKIHAIDKVLSN